ncbi:MAG TPA: hypothetical protein VE029_00960, partial [Rhizobacter sp.]|nr:hypothetical protein [Rhizobacter sp.]
VLDDLHTAAHHFSVDIDEIGNVILTAGPSVNGLECGAQHLAAGASLVVGEQTLALTAGRTHLRLRLASHALAGEQKLLATRSLISNLGTLASLTAAALALLVFSTYLDTDSEGFVRALGTLGISALGAVLAWCGLWTLLSKIFTHQAHFGWHLRVVLTALLALQLVDAGTSLLAFSLSWPWITDFSFVLNYAIGAAMLYFHLQAVDTHKPRRLRIVAVSTVVVGVALNMWFNVQNTDRVGSELYMNHLFPPALRLAKPVDTATFMQRLLPLKATLDDQAKKADDDE